MRADLPEQLLEYISNLYRVGWSDDGEGEANVVKWQVFG